MDKFQSELLAQLKEHNRLTKELVKLQRANFEEMVKIERANFELNTFGTYCGINAETSSEVKPKPAHWISSIKTGVDGKTKYYVCSSCGWSILRPNKMNWTYCPNCGMPMEIEKEGEEDAGMDTGE